MYLEYKIMILLCVDFITLLSQNTCFQEKLLEYTNLFSSNEYKKNGKIMCKYFKDKYVKSRVQVKKTKEASYHLDEIKLVQWCNVKRHVSTKFLLNNCLFQFQRLVVVFHFLHLLHQIVFLQSSTIGMKICAITAEIKKHR